MDLADQLSFVSMYPREHKVQAHFTNGKNVALGLPNDYENYEIRYAGRVKITKTDLDYIMGWQHVKVLSLKDRAGDDVANILAHRVNDIKFKGCIEELTLTIQSNTYDDWNVNTFLQLPNISLVRLSMDRLTDAQRVEFLDRKIPADWQFAYDRSAKDVTYRKQGAFLRSLLKLFF